MHNSNALLSCLHAKFVFYPLKLKAPQFYLFDMLTSKDAPKQNIILLYITLACNFAFIAQLESQSQLRRTRPLCSIACRYKRTPVLISISLSLSGRRATHPIYVVRARSPPQTEVRALNPVIRCRKAGHAFSIIKS